jgi:hypothetical protein
LELSSPKTRNTATSSTTPSNMSASPTTHHSPSLAAPTTSASHSTHYAPPPTKTIPSLDK